MKLQVSLPEEVIKNLAHLPTQTLLPPVWPPPAVALLSPALSFYHSCSLLSKSPSILPHTQVLSHDSHDQKRNGKEDACAPEVLGFYKVNKIKPMRIPQG